MTVTSSRPGTPSATVALADPWSTYETVATAQTAQALGTTGAIGDYLDHIIIQPLTTGPGVVTVIDLTATGGTVYNYPGGTVGADLSPITVMFQTVSNRGAWKITTGSNVNVTAIGRFS